MQAGVALLKAGHHTGDAAAFYAILQNGQGGGAIQHGRKVDGRISTRQSDTQAEGLGKPFRQGEVSDNKGFRRQFPRRQGKLQATRGRPSHQLLPGFLQCLGGPTVSGRRLLSEALTAEWAGKTTGFHQAAFIHHASGTGSTQQVCCLFRQISSLLAFF
ncbi:hypothetical protein Xsze_04376 [Xenorhabdus szentirmaii DSM 16338]|nr:hypothetical protein Xsze_04376 [Xenorhabdus szentirmaii DSM 16338]